MKCLEQKNSLKQKADQWLPGDGHRAEWRGTAIDTEVFAFVFVFGSGNKIFWSYIKMKVAQFVVCTKSQFTVYLKIDNFMVYELYQLKVVIHYFYIT